MGFFADVFSLGLFSRREPSALCRRQRLPVQYNFVQRPLDLARPAGKPPFSRTGGMVYQALRKPNCRKAYILPYLCLDPFFFLVVILLGTQKKQAPLHLAFTDHIDGKSCEHVMGF
ncbi:MAG: hypothetical protein JRJ60_10030 [Deltaproteobacteria bacterium]|nr:hypothetical protein [Deltaproteobacteria bacterium]